VGVPAVQLWCRTLTPVVTNGRRGRRKGEGEAKPPSRRLQVENAKGSNLYKFWGDSLANEINRELATHPKTSRFVVNCASQEYWAAIAKAGTLAYPVVTCEFPGPSVYAKQARGAMVRHVIDKRATRVEQLVDFDGAAGGLVGWGLDASSLDAEGRVAALGPEGGTLTFTNVKAKQWRKRKVADPPSTVDPAGGAPPPARRRRTSRGDAVP